VLVIAVFSVVQSLFGIGLLVFGTPTLLLLGYPFEGALAALLPASLTISLCQIARAGRPDAAFFRLFALWCLLPLGVSLAAVLSAGAAANLNPVVALLLVAFVLLRVFPDLNARAASLIVGRERPWLLLTGVVHGLSNLGGALLLVFAASRHQRKDEIRALIAFCYACFAATQLIVLAWLTPGVFGRGHLVYPAVAAMVFLTLGQRVFRGLSAPVFDSLLTSFAAGYAALLGLRSAGII
jgi:uncharacterized membrane protein YfcA